MLPYRWRLLPIQALVDLAGPLNVLGVTLLLPFAQAEFDVPRSTIVWLIVAYSLGSASFILPSAYLGNTVGRRKMVMLGALVACASQFGVFFAPGIEWLVSMRVVSGVANALMMANIPALTIGAFSSDRRGRALGIVAIGLGVGLLVSPIVAGVFADTLGWRVIFLLIAALYGAVLAGAFLVIREVSVDRTEPVSVRRFDYPGAALGMGVLIFLILAMQKFGAPADPSLAAVYLALSTACAIGFVLLELRSPYPLLDPRLFRRLPFSLAAVRNVGVIGMWSSNGFLLSFYMIQGLDWSGTFAGTVLVAHYSGRLLGSPLSGYLVDRVGQAKPMLAAFVLLVIGGLLLIALGSDPSLMQVLVSLFVVGVAFGIFAPPIQAALYANVPPEKLSLAPGTISLTAHIGITVGAALAAAILGSFLGDSIPSAVQWTMAVMLGGFVTLFGLSWLFLGSGRGVGLATWRAWRSSR